MLKSLVVFTQCLMIASAFSLSSLNTKVKNSIQVSKVTMSVPLELKGQLDPSKLWEVKLIFNGKENTVLVPEDESILEASDKVFDISSSCRNGVCTTCSGQILGGRENTLLAVHGLDAEHADAGYVCTCQCYARGPGVIVKLGTFDEVYELQYGRFEKSYEMKFGKREEEPKKKKNIFGF